jgi:hypothetical protein
MNEVNLDALANQATPLQSHRGGTGEIRYISIDLVDEAGHPLSMLAPGGMLIVRAAYRAERNVEQPVFQLAIIDVDTGLIITTAASSFDDASENVMGDGVVEWRFEHLPLRPRHYVVRVSISDRHQLASYDVVTAGPRFAVSGRGLGVDGITEEEDGLVSVPYEFSHGAAVSSAPHR